MYKLSLIPLLLGANKQSIFAFRVPTQTGPFVTGVRDFEFTDKTYPSAFKIDAD